MIGHSLAIAAVASTGLLYWMLARMSGDFSLFLLFFLMITMVAAFLGGWAGALSTTLSVFTISFFFTPPGADRILSLGLFCASGLLVSLIAGRLGKGRDPVVGADELVVGPRGTAQDTSDRKASEEDLRRSQALLNVVVENSPDPIFIKDAQSRIIMANPATLALIGKPAEEVIGRNDSEFRDDSVVGRTIVATDKRIMESNRAEIVEEVAFTPTGYRSYLSTKTPWRDSEGRVIGLLGVSRDITDRKRMEQELRENQERFALALRATEEGVWDWNLDTNAVYYSPRWTEMLGYAEGDVPRDPASWQRLLHPDDKERVRRTLDQILRGEREFEMEFRLRHKDGRYVEILSRGLPVRREAGGPITRIVGTHFDLTERKKAEAELRESKERFELAVRGAGVGIWDWDLRSGTVYFSPRWKALLGYQEDEIGESLDDWSGLLHPNEAESVCTYQKDLLKSSRSSVSLEYRLRHKDGSYRWIEANAVVVRDATGKACRLVGSHGDITARKLAEQRLHADLDALTRLHEISVRQLREGSMDAVFGEIMEAAVAIAGADRGILRLIDPASGSIHVAAQHGHEPRFLELLTSSKGGAGMDDEPLEHSRRVVIPDVEASPQLSGTEALRGLREAGVRALESTPIMSRRGRLLGILTTEWSLPHVPYGHDLWRIDLLARETADLIEQRQGQEDRLKWAAQIQRSQKLDGLGALAAGIAHDFNNLLSGIFGHIELARMNVESGEFTQGADSLAKAMGAMGRARALTRQLITFAKGGAPIRRSTEMAPLIRGAVDFALSGSSVSVEWEMEGNLWPCEVDAVQLTQALGNILLNAKEAMPEGGTVHVGARNLPESASLPRGLSAGRYVLISIRDEGPGIPETLLERIFDPFFTTKPGAHGLGLTVAHSVVQRHHGCIDAESGNPKGAMFHVYLPASGEKAPQTDASKPDLKQGRGKPGAGNGSILLMDDEWVILEAASRMLQSLGYRVTCASNGQEAIELYRKSLEASHPFDLVILDLTVRNGLGGKEAIVELLRLDPSVRAIVSSGYDDDPVMDNPSAYGFVMRLSKPYSLSEMRIALQKAHEVDGRDR